MKRRIAFGAVLFAVIALGAAIYASAAPRARAAATTSPPQSMTMAVTGAKQGVFAKPSIPILTLSHGIVSPRDAASGLPTGKRQHSPITVTMDWGATTPKFINALVTNETLKTVSINLLRNGTVVATIKLVNASVSQYGQTDQGVEISMTYQKITWTWISGGITASDDWEQTAG